MNMEFATQLATTNKQTVFKLVQHGGHFVAMIQQGIPAGIQRLKSLQKKPTT